MVWLSTATCTPRRPCRRLRPPVLRSMCFGLWWLRSMGKHENHLEEGCSIMRRCVDHILTFWGSFAYNTATYGTGCPTPYKIIILGEKMITQ